VSIRLVDGQWLIVDGQLATDDNCCCAPPCSGACDEENPCPEGCYCCDGVCQAEPCDPPCSGACDEENPCPEGCYCCDGVCQAEPCGCCCVDGAPDPTKATEAACDAAGGTWSAGNPCGAYDCRCCEGFKTICLERVWGTYTKVYGPGASSDCDSCPVNDTEAGTIAIDTGNLSCGGTAAGQYNSGWDNRCADEDGNTPVLENGVSITLAKYYDRWRAVADCSECINDAEAAFCVPGVSLLGCYAWDDVGLSGMRAYLCECNTVNLCDTEVSGLAVAQQAGPGTELKALLKTIGIVASPTCKCNKMARQMDQWGPDESLAHMEEIVDVMEETARARKLPFLRVAARQLVRLAVRRARKKDIN
jgi:hypothetical protein